MTNKQDEQKKLEEALIDVRKAYRLLHNYQRMVLDAMNYIGSQLGLTYNGGWAKYSNASPRNGSGKLDLWAWDWLNMMCYEFGFSERLQASEREVRFSVLLISDTGWFESGDSWQNKVKTDAYPHPDKSHSKMLFLTTTKEWDFPDAGNAEKVQELIATEKSQAHHDENTGMFIKCYDVSCLCDRDKVDHILEEFVKLAKVPGLSIKDCLHN